MKNVSIATRNILGRLNKTPQHVLLIWLPVHYKSALAVQKDEKSVVVIYVDSY